MNPAGTPRHRAIVAGCVVFVVAVSVRLLHVWQMQGTPFFSMLMGDARGYDLWAQEIAAGDWYGHEVFYQAPLYPYFLGVLYSLFGRDLWLVRAVQALLGAVGCVCLAEAGRRLFSPAVGIVAGLALALYAPAIFFDGLIQKSSLDMLFACGALALVGLLAQAPGRPAPAGWLALGLTTGLVSLTRENALLLIGVFSAWALLRRDEPWLRRLVAATLFVAGVTTVVLPVAVRNRAVGGTFFVTTSQFGPNFYIGNNPQADGTYASLRFGRGSPEHERADATLLAERAQGRRLSPAEVSAYWTRRALAFITSQPRQWAALQVRKLALLLNADEMLDTESQEAHAEWSWPLTLLGPFTHFGVVVPLAIIGLWATWPARSRLWVLYAAGLALALSTVAFYVFARYRHPLVPLLLLWSAAGVVHLWNTARRGTPWPLSRQALSGLFAVVVAGVGTNWPLLSSNLMRAITETNLGTAFYEDRRLDEATTHYRRAIAIQADYAPAYNNLGVALRAQGRLDEAIGAYRAGLGVRSDYPDLHYNLANALLEKKDPASAAQHLRLASATLPDSAGVRNNLGQALAEQGQLDAATTELRRAVALDPSSATAHHNLGNVLASRGLTRDALQSLRRSLELDRSNPATWYDTGSVLLEAGRAPDAVDALAEAARLAPGSAQTHNNLGIALAQSGRVKDALAEFERALSLRPDFEDARRNLALARGAGAEAARRNR